MFFCGIDVASLAETDVVLLFDQCFVLFSASVEFFGLPKNQP